MDLSKINSIILFGSFATGEINGNSDIDICIITKESANFSVDEKKLKKYVRIEDDYDLSIIIYPPSTINVMLESGSLFLWHLNLEGKIIYGRNFFNEQIKQLKKFNGHLDELNYIKEIFMQLKYSCIDLNIVTNFDYSLQFSLIRNSCIVITDYYKSPQFGKITSFSSTKEIFPEFPMNLDQYKKLYYYKILYAKDDKNIDDKLDIKDFNEYLHLVEKSIEFCIDKIK